jgi:hypothetical protein
MDSEGAALETNAASMRVHEREGEASEFMAAFWADVKEAYA